MNGGYQAARFGWSGNNEGDCNTNDSCIGFGCRCRYCSPYDTAAGASNSCNNGKGNGYIYIR